MKCLPIVVLGVLMLSPLVQARSKDAMAIFEEGRLLYKQGSYDQALERMQEAYAIQPNAVLLYNIALCHEKLRDYTNAKKLFQKYLQDNPKAENRAKVESRLRSIEEALAQVPGYVRVESIPSGGAVAVQGVSVGMTPCVIQLMPGRHRLTLTLDGYIEGALDVDVTAGFKTTMTHHFVSLPLVAKKKNWMPGVGPWVLWGVGMATLGAAIPTGAIALKNRNKSEDMSSDPSSGWEDLEAKAFDQSLASNILYSISGALAVSGLIWWLASPKEVVVTQKPKPVSLGLGPSRVLVLGRF